MRQRKAQALVKIENFSVDIFSIRGGGMEGEYGKRNMSSREFRLYIYY